MKVKILSSATCLLLAAGLSFLSASCHCKKKAAAAAASETKRDFAAEGYAKATVIYYELDGCNFMLQLEDSTRLEPASLPDNFKKDKLAVWVKYIPKKNAVSICMSGRMVDVTDIQLRK